ncbi:hypothetical protein VC83_00218 [Pseudogymnoascus destructans]|uniref:Uncharacterized protein n=1 Tax=Pseudogymnoascus destructans TaxID=655981 RepID=A0A177AKP3_9PEZI|nr:uncharacterized protein VC83_09366 [Pseudogymnoascus destructans]XP_024320566.1 uncharacterized protein VC83_08218 [Pseudogymnoascus destructans]XP_024322607.1 uncharacterized protein VC83_04546 [Pseudogymnoascus destructans]XP_024323520.1 uncharacterized protein VC83_06547 [Pseudogymnoascus destructans]XP_024323609.1 uncharacterized protein VC83_06492 [Pseudogymnoascus destructans]XP_024323698.1 uncharacterized protein VC83_06546 [Pseudogymnoascus destructans]XP_024326771.1 uncharacterize
MAKLKAHEELSTNANTIKARNCVSNLTEDEKAVHLALKADHADLSYYLKKLYKSAKYKTRLQNELKVERICVRTEKGTHASCIANQKVKNISASSSPQAPPSTPPKQLLSELAAFEARDILNDEAVLPDELSDEEITSTQALLTQAHIDAHEESNFRKWQHFWDSCIHSYTRKAGKLRKKPERLFEYMPWIDVEEGFKEAFLLVYSKKFDKEKWAKVSAAQDMLFLELE